MSRTGWIVTAALGTMNDRKYETGELRSDGQPGFDIAADGVEQYEQCTDILCFLHCGEQRHDVLILGRFRVRRQHHMSFDLPDDRDAVDLSDPEKYAAPCASVYILYL